MKEIIKKIKKNSDAIDFDDMQSKKNWISIGNGRFKSNPLRRTFINIEKWSKNENSSLVSNKNVEEGNIEQAIVKESSTKFKEFIDNVNKFETNAKIKEPILSETQKINQYWIDLYNESKTYAQKHLWWREVFLGNIRS